MVSENLWREGKAAQSATKAPPPQGDAGAIRVKIDGWQQSLALSENPHNNLAAFTQFQAKSVIPSKAILIQPSHGPGSLQHFWHFNFGMLLPLLHAHFSGALGDLNPCVPSCGPLMDEILHEVLPAFFPEYSIVRREEIGALEGKLPSYAYTRWDLTMELWDQANGRWDRSMLEGSELCEIKAQIKETARHVFNNPRHECQCGGPLPPPESLLLLERSPQHDFYLPTGPAEAKGYGKGRRTIANLGECREKLEAAGQKVHFYEPGVHSYSCQMRTFFHAAAVVGIRGAEFANLIWCKPGTPIYMIRPKNMVNGFQKIMAWVSDINLHEETVDTSTPDADASKILHFLESATCPH